jgi:leucine dehydrogenase
VDSLGGLYITAEDVNIAIPDLQIVRRSTQYVKGLSREEGGSGNPSPYTAYGVFLGIRAACEWVYDLGSMSNRRIAVQGVGAVGSALVRRLVREGASVVVADTRQDRVDALVRGLGVEAVGIDEVLEVECDVLAPCALGAIINDETLPKLRCKIIAGGANNQLHEERHGHELSKREIVYAPDYVINAGGIINVSAEFAEGGYNEPEALRRIERIPQALKEVWTISKDKGVPSSEAADHLAEQIVADARR